MSRPWDFAGPATDGPFHRFEIGAGGPSRTLVLHHEPDRAPGSWGFGAGTAHHLALEMASDEGLAEQKGLYEELGYTDCSEIKDRNYFHSIYVRSPGGILTECAALVPEGFAKDEPIDDLGRELLLPPWFEHRRDEIVAMLEPIVVPEANRPSTALRRDVQRRRLRRPSPRPVASPRPEGRARRSSAATSLNDDRAPA